MHIHPSQEQFRAVVERGIAGPVVMLNLLRYRDVADYSAHPLLASNGEVSGREAYRRYGAAVLPLLAEHGGEVLLDAGAGAWLIGPDEEWDDAVLVRYPALEAFGAMTSSPAYLEIMGHRDAALADSRLLPLSPTA